MRVRRAPSFRGRRFEARDWAELLKKLRKRWDDAPKPWKEFKHARAAAVVEVDVDNESVSAKEVEGIGLNA